MWLHPATQRNVETLKGWGVQFIEPSEGLLACGYEGIGRLAPLEDILQESDTILHARKKM
jgi:phosphopantothenoylcysteine synthetase/decarboxylase